MARQIKTQTKILDDGTVLKLCTNEKCSDPWKTITVENFGIRYYNSSGEPYFHTRCKNCEIARANEYNSKHREERKAYSKKFQKENPEYKKQWKEKNRDKENQKYNERIKTDPCFKLRRTVSRSVLRMLEKFGNNKDGHSVLEFFGYTIEELYSHLETLFTHSDNITPDGEIWMTMNNHGIYDPKTWNDNDSATWKWHIDHIIPHSELPYDTMDHPNFKKAWALSNIRPFSAKQNIIDGATRVRHKKT